MEERTHQRQGKIARLPVAIRNQVNQRLRDGEPASKIIAWLHGEAEVLDVLAEHFDGALINDGNVSEWRKGGYQDWLNRQTKVAETQALAKYALKLSQAGNNSLTGGAAAIAAGQLLTAMENAADDDLEGLIDAVCKLRGLDLAEQKLSLEREKHGLKTEALDLSREKFETQTVKTFLTWAKSPEAQAILNSGKTQAVQMDQLHALFFGTTATDDDNK